MRKKLDEPEVKKKIIKILSNSVGFVSVASITKLLKDNYKITRSPQVIERYLLELEKDNKVQKEKYGETK